MKKVLLFSIMLLGALMMPQMAQADEIASGQSTEGKDFWVTFMQADQHTSDNGPIDDKYNYLILSLSVSAREDCDVTVTNPFTSSVYSETKHVTAGQTETFEIYNGHPVCQNARAAMTTSGKVCYAVNSEVVDTCALHVTSTKDISLFATNYKKATFDATNVIPTTSLLDEYIIQTYSPSDHQGASKTQGSHFAIIATKDSTVVEYVPTVETKSIRDFLTQYNSWGEQVFDIYPEYERFRNFRGIGDTLVSDTLMEGQVWYVWTGMKDGADGDLSGTYIRSKDPKKPIAVFQGCPHTNIPYKVEQRDHIYSQAMPTQYWGNTFALTASADRPADAIRVLALSDQTDVYINGTKVHTIDFSVDTKHYWEFEIGAEGNYAKNGSCMLTTSCPAAVHLFETSQKYHSYSSGDPAMLWINPIEQQIDQVTFNTYASKNGTTQHYVNIVTDKPNSMLWNNNSVSGFTQVDGSSIYYYKRLDLGTTSSGSKGVTHTLKCTDGNFIAHVYGFTGNESYAYSAGGATKPLNATITINGDTLVAGETSQICRYDLHSNTIPFTCRPDYEYKEIIWNFGDGTPIVYGHADEIHGKTERTTGDSIVAVSHDYEKDSIYQAYVVIVRNSSSTCAGRNLRDSFPMEVVLDKLKITYKELKDHICSDAGTGTFRIYYTSSHKFDDSNSKIEYNDIAKNDGFTTPENHEDPSGTYFEVSVPSTSKSGQAYEIVIALQSKCGNDTSTIPFTVNYPAAAILDKRWTNTIAVWSAKDMKDHIVTNNPDDHSLDGVNYFDGYEWFKLDSTDMYNTKHYSKMTDEQSSFIVKEHVPVSGEYYVDIHYTDANGEKKVISSCPIAFGDQQYDAFASDATISNVGNIIIKHAPDHKMLVMSAKDGEATWLNAEGNTLKTFEVNAGGSLLPYPSTDAHGLYILRVEAGKDEKSIKVFIQ